MAVPPPPILSRKRRQNEEKGERKLIFFWSVRGTRQPDSEASASEAVKTRVAKRGGAMVNGCMDGARRRPGSSPARPTPLLSVLAVFRSFSGGRC